MGQSILLWRVVLSTNSQAHGIYAESSMVKWSVKRCAVKCNRLAGQREISYPLRGEKPTSGMSKPNPAYSVCGSIGFAIGRCAKRNALYRYQLDTGRWLLPLMGSYEIYGVYFTMIWGPRAEEELQGWYRRLKQMKDMRSMRSGQPTQQWTNCGRVGLDD